MFGTIPLAGLNTDQKHVMLSARMQKRREGQVTSTRLQQPPHSVCPHKPTIFTLSVGPHCSPAPVNFLSGILLSFVSPPSTIYLIFLAFLALRKLA